MRKSRLNQTAEVFQKGKQKKERKKEREICNANIRSNAGKEDRPRKTGTPFLSQNIKYRVVFLITPDLKGKR